MADLGRDNFPDGRVYEAVISSGGVNMTPMAVDDLANTAEDMATTTMVLINDELDGPSRVVLGRLGDVALVPREGGVPATPEIT